MIFLFASAWFPAMVIALRRHQDGTDTGASEFRLNASIAAHSSMETDSGVELGAGTLLRGRYVLKERITDRRKPIGKFPSSLQNQFTGKPEHMGTGGYGDIWKAYDSQLQKYVAVKIFYSSKYGMKRYLDWESADFLEKKKLEEGAQECSMVQKMMKYSDMYVGSSRICQCYQDHIMDAVQTANPVFLVLELCGKPLDDILAEKAKRGKADVDQARDWVKQILEGISFIEMFDPPLIHHDLKPQNIVVDGDDLKLIDWGAAISATTDGKRGSGSYTPAYAAPEVLESKNKVAFEPPAHAYDVYAIGLMYMQMLCPKVAFKNWYDTKKDSQKDLSKHDIDKLMLLCKKMGMAPHEQDVELIVRMLSRKAVDRPAPFELLTSAPLADARWVAPAQNARFETGQAVLYYSQQHKQNVEGSIANVSPVENRYVYDVSTPDGTVEGVHADYLTKPVHAKLE